MAYGPDQMGSLTVLALFNGWKALSGLQRQFLQVMGHRFAPRARHQHPQYARVTLHSQTLLGLHISSGGQARVSPWKLPQRYRRLAAISDYTLPEKQGEKTKGFQVFCSPR